MLNPINRRIWVASCVIFTVTSASANSGTDQLVGSQEPSAVTSCGAASTFGLPHLDEYISSIASEEKIELGRKLFMDRRLAHNETLSCAMCHVPEQAFTVNELRTAVGAEGRSMNRNAPTLLNVLYSESLFHDGRETSLENQVWGPLLARNEMANPSIGAVISRIRSIPDYENRFIAVYDEAPTISNIGDALAAYQRTLISANSPFDRWRYAGETDALSAAQKAGYALFTGKANCHLCHTVGKNSALFTDDKFHNSGIGWRASMGASGRYQTIQLAPGITVDVERSVVNSFGGRRESDTGRYAITRNPDDRWKYRTPGLRNVELTAPYMHDGSINTLREVVSFYNQGGIDNPLKDARLVPLGLSGSEMDAIVAFLNALTGDCLPDLIEKARTH